MAAGRATKSMFQVEEGKTSDNSALEPIVTTDEVQHLEELGLGRGIDCTDPKMWNNKSPWQLREINSDCSNIIGNYDGGIKFGYHKFVSSVRTQQSKIQSSLNIPSSKVNIGLDAYYSQQTSSSVTITGTKVQTRTISYRHNFEDLSKSLATSTTDIESDTNLVNNFESNLSYWILSKLNDMKKDGLIPKEPQIDALEGDTAVERLNSFTADLNIGNSQANALVDICKDFLLEFGLTHYVSAISLGAMSYVVKTETKETTKLGAGGEVKVASVASAGASSELSTEQVERTRSTQEIGQFDKYGIVRRNTRDEQVIGFEIEPVSKLIRIAKMQLAMRVAIDNYIQGKKDNTFGPFLVSSHIEDKIIYWKVDGSLVKGTDDLSVASLFYCVSGTHSQFYETEFNIVYYGDEKSDRKMIQNIENPLSKLRSTPPKVQQFLTVDKPRKSDTPLVLKKIVNIDNANFSIFQRKRRTFGCIQIYNEKSTIQNWLDGDEYFLKQMSHSLFGSKYVIMKKTEINGEVNYTTTVVSKVQPASDVGLLFRIHPSELRDRYRASLKKEVRGGRDQFDETVIMDDEIEIAELLS